MGFVRITAAAALIVGAGFVHGAWSGRWASDAALAALAARVDSVPMTIGDGKATALEPGPRERTMAGAEACLSRTYTQAARGISISVLLLAKRYVVREFSGAAVEPDRDPCKDSLDVSLPELHRAAFAQAG
jgi:hypothetical protein